MNLPMAEACLEPGLVVSIRGSGTILKSAYRIRNPFHTRQIFFKTLVRKCTCRLLGAYTIARVIAVLSIVHIKIMYCPLESRMLSCSWQPDLSLGQMLYRYEENIYMYSLGLQCFGSVSWTHKMLQECAFAICHNEALIVGGLYPWHFESKV